MKKYFILFLVIKGWAFSSTDLIKKFDRQQIDNVLSDLVKDKKIRRVSRGIYDYPKYSDFLKKELNPDIEQISRAYARKFNWRIEVSGDSALNILNLSTQIQAKYIYLSDGPNKSYKLFNNVKNSHALYTFVVFYLFLFIEGFYINTALKKSFARYKKYLHLKRKRANNFRYTSKKL